jgi:CRP/FNR family cyclic AMP-dependent transcriptional regulator
MVRRRRDTSHADILRTLPIFSTCSKKELSTIASAGKEVQFEAGKMICKEGESGAGMHIILEGETRVQVGGRTKRRLGPGAFFGEIALLDGGPRTATVIAETPVRTFSLTSWSFKSLLKSQPGLALKMLEGVCRRIRKSDASISD